MVFLKMIRTADGRVEFENRLLDIGSEVGQIEDLGDAGAGDAGNAGNLGLVLYLAVGQHRLWRFLMAVRMVKRSGATDWSLAN